MTIKRLIDVSHTVEDGMVTYPGFQAPLICDWMSREASRARYAHGTEFQIGKIEMIANTGTYIDSPFHRYADGKDISDLPLESVADVECLVVRVDPAQGPAIDSVPLAAGRGDPAMAVSPALQRKLQQTLGVEAAGDLLAWMQNMDAERGDIVELRHEMQLGFARIDEKFARLDERFARTDGRMDTMQASMERMMERGLREQTRFFFLAWSVLLAAIIGLYARA
jgi:kynurenine formamidase